MLMVQFDEGDQKARVTALLKKEAEEAAERLAEQFNLPYVDLNLRAINTNALQVIPEPESREKKMAVFEKVDNKIEVAILSPTNRDTQEKIDQLKQTGYSVNLHVASETSLEKAWKLYQDISQTDKTQKGGFAISEERITNLTKKFKTVDDVSQEFKTLLKDQNKLNTTTAIEVMMAGALSVNASDIHLEPQDEQTRLRYRLDGALVDISDLPHKIYKPMLSRLKLLSGLKLNITDEAQDGRFSIDYGDLEIEIRSSIIPGEYGESIVMRILNPESINVSLEDLGMYPRFLKVLEEQISRPNGMILNTGPTGSGKTTTLYSSLRKVYTPEKKILTIENPIEYHLEGIVQTGVDHKRGYTFAAGLRSAMRQDPDIIMVGEIRDEETASTAINAALTGHLVFSTLHTNTAAGTFPRLIELGANPKVISSALNLAMAQRLVRRLCPDCKQKAELDASNQERIEKVLRSINDSSYTEDLSLDNVYQPVGCSECNNMGYKGRVALYEGILTTPEVEAVVIQNPSEREIMEAAKDQGLLFLPQDGVLKILQGVTSIEEVETKVGLVPPF